MKNKYIKSSKLSEAKFRLLLKCYSADNTASRCAYIIGVHINTAERIFTLLRKRLANISIIESKDYIGGEVELDESYLELKELEEKEEEEQLVKHQCLDC